MATGRSDYPNQVNNVLCFPFIFRGALDVGATAITREMELAAVNAIAELAQAEQSDIVALAYGEQNLSFGPDYLIPRPFDPRLIAKVAPAVAQARRWTAASPRARSRISTPTASACTQFVYQSGLIMKPVFTAAKRQPPARRICRRRRRARAARGAGGRRRELGAAHSDRPADGDRGAHRAPRPALEARARLRDRRSRRAIRAIANTGRTTTGSPSARA